MPTREFVLTEEQLEIARKARARKHAAEFATYDAAIPRAERALRLLEGRIAWLRAMIAQRQNPVWASRHWTHAAAFAPPDRPPFADVDGAYADAYREDVEDLARDMLQQPRSRRARQLSACARELWQEATKVS